jgi:hypothetical protein
MNQRVASDWDAILSCHANKFEKLQLEKQAFFGVRHPDFLRVCLKSMKLRLTGQSQFLCFSKAS